MLSAPQQAAGCILANPEISGIGIRASTYAQNFLGVFLAIQYLMDGKISSNEAEYIETASNTILMTGCAIIISAIIQAKTIGLSAYHAMIVLNLSWMNNSYLTISWVFRVGESDLEEIIASSLSRRKPKKKISRFPIGLGLAHLSLMAGFGIWLWQNIDTFGDRPQCTPYIFTVIFGQNVSAMNTSLRAGSLALYWITAIPIVNLLAISLVVVVVVLFVLGLTALINRQALFHVGLLISWNLLQGRIFYLQFVLLLDVLFAVDTELMIHRSRPLVQPGESQWTFGQTLAVIVTIIPLLEARKCIKWWRRSKYVSHFQGAPMNTTSQKLSFRREPSPQTKCISLDYQGDAPLTVNPPIDGSTTITKGSTTAIVSNSEPYKFSVKDSVVATIHNHDDNNEVKIAGGVEGAETFTLTVALK